MRAGILWPPLSQPFHSGGSPGLKCTPGQQQTWGWTAAACWPGYSGLSAGTHKPPLRQSENVDKSWCVSLPWASPHCHPKDMSLSRPLRGFQPPQTPQDKTPKGVTSFQPCQNHSWAQKRVLLFVCPNFRDQGKQLHPSPPSLSISTSSVLLSKVSYQKVLAQFPHKEE